MKLENWQDDRPQQSSLDIEPDKHPRETRIETGASDDFVDDRQNVTVPDTGDQSTLSGETVEEKEARENSDSTSLGEF